jgi:uncharacterized protein YcbK (DUF882 family)
MQSVKVSRWAMALLGLLAISGLGTADTTSPSGEPYRLRFYQLHTGERLDVVYRKGNDYDPEALARIDYLLRDYRNGEVRAYDPRLLDVLHELTQSLGRPSAEINVVCGYRTPGTNAYLRAHGHAVAEHSLHMQAMAIDIRIPGVSTSEIRDAALKLKRGGVGFYGEDGFVHVDVGRVRRW